MAGWRGLMSSTWTALRSMIGGHWPQRQNLDTSSSLSERLPLYQQEDYENGDSASPSERTVQLLCPSFGKRLCLCIRYC